MFCSFLPVTLCVHLCLHMGSRKESHNIIYNCRWSDSCYQLLNRRMSTFNVNKSVLEKRDHKLLSVLKSSQVTQILSQAQRCRSSQWQKKDPDNLLQQPREEGERMRFMSVPIKRQSCCSRFQVQPRTREPGYRYSTKRSSLTCNSLCRAHWWLSLTPHASALQCLCSGKEKKNKQATVRYNYIILKLGTVLTLQMFLSPHRDEP